MSEILENENEQTKRPASLLVIAILSLINIGWSLLSNVTSLINGPLDEEAMEEAKVEMTKGINDIRGTEGTEWLEDILRSSMHMIETMNENHTLNVLSSIIILLIGIAGVIFMLKGRRLGFHAYIVYSFLASVQIYLFVAPSLLSNTIVIMSLIVSGVFIILYGMSLKWMK